MAGVNRNFEKYIESALTLNCNCVVNKSIHFWHGNGSENPFLHQISLKVSHFKKMAQYHFFVKKQKTKIKTWTGYKNNLSKKKILKLLTNMKRQNSMRGSLICLIYRPYLKTKNYDQKVPKMIFLPKNHFF